jgi:hypothetical protein
MLKMYLGVGKIGGVSSSPSADSILVAQLFCPRISSSLMAFVRPLLPMWNDLLVGMHHTLQ